MKGLACLGLILLTTVTMFGCGASDTSAPVPSGTAGETTQATSDLPLDTLENDAVPSTGLIAFASFVDGNQEIYAVFANGSGARRLTESTGADHSPAWSPDGTRIAFVSERDGNSEIYVMNADGSNQVNLTNNPNDDSQPAWSPDGNRITFTTNRWAAPDTYVINSDGSNETRLTNGDVAAENPMWSADGQQVFVGGGYVVKADGTDLKQWWLDLDVGDLGWERASPYSPDGKLMAYVDLDGELVVVGADGSGLTSLTAGSDLAGNLDGESRYDYFRYIAWSPDSRSVAFFHVRLGNPALGRMYSASVDQAQLTKVAEFSRLERELDAGIGPPAWSHDGSRIAFCSNHESTEDIYVVAGGGSPLINLTGGTHEIGGCFLWGKVAWSPRPEAISLSPDTTNPTPPLDTCGRDGIAPTSGSTLPVLPNGTIRICFPEPAISINGSNTDAWAMTLTGPDDTRVSLAINPSTDGSEVELKVAFRGGPPLGSYRLEWSVPSGSSGVAMTGKAEYHYP